MDFQRAELDEAISRMKRLAEAWRRALVEDATTGGLRKATTNTPVSLPPQLRSAAAEEEGGQAVGIVGGGHSEAVIQSREVAASGAADTDRSYSPDSKRTQPEKLGWFRRLFR